MVDTHFKWPIVIPTKDTSAENTVKMMLVTFTTHGLCEQIASDNGSEFTSEFFQKFCKEEEYSTILNLMGKQRDLYKLLTSLKKYILSGDKMKPDFLDRCRVTPHSTTSIAPCELLLKHHLRTKLDLYTNKTEFTDKTNED